MREKVEMNGTNGTVGMNGMRTKKIFLNMLFDIIPYILIGLVGLVKVNFLITYIGDAGNGYYQTINQIIAYVFLAQAGFSEAVTYKLYKPFAKDNKKSINEIYSGARVIFRRIGFLILGIATIVTIALYFFYNFEAGFRISALLCFFIIVVSYLISYFGKTQCYIAVLSANQDKYVFTSVLNIIKLICDITIVFVIVWFRSLVAIAIVIFILKIIEEIIMRIVVKRKYKWLHEVSKKDTSAYKMTKDLIWYQIGHLILYNVDSVLLMAFIGPVAVSIYSSYNFILRYLNEITARVNGSTVYSFGNVFAKGEDDRAFPLFVEYLMMFLIIAFSVTITFMIGIRSFVNLWIGDVSYIVSIFTVFLFAASLFLNTLYYPLSSIVIPNGLFKDNKHQIFISASINIVVSLILINFMGMDGLLLGTIISLIVNLIMKVFLIVKKVFKDKKVRDILPTFLIAMVIFTLISYIIHPLEHVFYTSINGWVELVLSLGLIFVILFIVTFLIFCLLNKNTRNLLSRLKMLLRRKRA